MDIPPGPLYLANLAFLFLGPPLLSCLLFHIANEHLGITTPLWLVITLSLLFRPSLLVVRILYTDYANQREATARGATLAPNVYDHLPGGLSITKAIVKSFKYGYPGMPCDRRDVQEP